MKMQQPNGLPSNQPPPRFSDRELRQFRAHAHSHEARRYEWLAMILRDARKPDVASKVEAWAKEHEQLAYDLLGLPGKRHG